MPLNDEILRLPKGGFIEFSDGDRFYWNASGALHRVDGPAVIRSDDSVEYWYNGERVSESTYHSDDFQCKMLMEQ